jgi:hypothetical protein
MYPSLRLPAARSRHPRHRIVGLAIAVSATLVTGIGVIPAAQAAAPAAVPAPSVWDRVAACESGGNWAISTGNGYYGGLQFSTSTWRAFGGFAYAVSANRAAKAAQIAIARRVLAVQGPGAWPVCGRRAGLTRANGGADLRAIQLVVDGKLGPLTIRAIQRWVGTTQNGVLGSPTIKALQRKVGVGPDGAIGPLTVRALQVRIGARRDGARSLNAATVMVLQRYLNLH